MRHMDVDERRARLGWRHHLAAEHPGADTAAVARSLVALHSTDAASVFLATAARAPDVDASALEAALYDERSVVRMLGMRRTVFVVPVDAVSVVQAACTTAIAARERRRLVQLVEDAGVAVDGERWVQDAAADTVAALRARGAATAAELSADVPALRAQVVLAAGTRQSTAQGVSTRMLFVLAAEGQIVRGRPRGSWISTQYRWSPIETWLPGGIPTLGLEEAQAELARRWLLAFGPAPAADLKWWAGWTMGETRRALAHLRPVEVGLDGGLVGLVLPDDVAPARRPQPWAALLPALDPTVMGWSDRRWFLGAHGPALFDRTGNAGPTVWWDGRVVGGWAQRRGGDVVVRLLEDVGADAAAAVQSAAERLQAWLGAARVTPRFRTPLERELAS